MLFSGLFGGKKENEDLDFTYIHFKVDGKDRINFFFECNQRFTKTEFFSLVVELSSLRAQAEEFLSLIESKRTDLELDVGFDFSQILELTTGNFDLKITGRPSKEDIINGLSGITRNLIGKFADHNGMSKEDFQVAYYKHARKDVSLGSLNITGRFYANIK